jgi:HSP20 family molecular chaperone IbpA
MSALTTTTKEGGNQLAQAELTRDRPLYIPRFDICETEDALMLCGDLPGVEPDSLDIRFENRELVIHGKVQPRNGRAQYLYQEYGVGDYHRSFTISEGIDSSKIAASMRDGVLTIHLPKTDQVKPRRIKVTSE